MANPPQPDHRRLIDRLQSGDPTAPDDLAVAMIQPLYHWLRRKNRGLHAHLIEEAVDEALINLIKNPVTYDANKLSLESYLRMSAHADLLNILAKEERHHTNRLPFSVVELSPDPRKYIGQADGSLNSDIDDTAGKARRIAEKVRQGLTAAEGKVLDLWLRGEKKTAVFAHAYGVTDRPADEQRRIIKKVKDKLKQRAKRAREK
jgi:hypothetical protein